MINRAASTQAAQSTHAAQSARAAQSTPAATLNIGEAAKASGVSAKMIRHYESIGLTGAVRRTDAGYRIYTEQDVQVLQFVHRGRALGFSLDQIGELLALWQDKHRASADVRALARRHIDELNRKISEMESMRRTLETLARSCHGDARSDCPILDDLAAHNGAKPADATPSNANPAKAKPSPQRKTPQA